MVVKIWTSRKLLENASVTRTRTGTRTGTGTGTWTTGVTAIALCTSCSRAKNSTLESFDDTTLQIKHGFEIIKQSFMFYGNALKIILFAGIFLGDGGGGGSQGPK